MTNSRIHRFIMEVAPPEFVSVMRQRRRTMLDTISEDDRDGSYADTSIPAAAAAASFTSSSSSATTVMARYTNFFM
ncbi:uncharacterized protein LOC120205965 [Hibiscus syriacus]|uniref:uncharacterized protein LOC120205965 n=1 Tax=Hibiscus syriacus TaxID=106335 RepID=UPI0019227E17|nr:uncharacterized protein LOC120205965 [Hibiscus syriacus]